MRQVRAERALTVDSAMALRFSSFNSRDDIANASISIHAQP